MPTDLPDFLKSGEPARLLPVVADSSKEVRAAFIALAVLFPELELLNKKL
jgi:hypothetical protein